MLVLSCCLISTQLSLALYGISIDVRVAVPTIQVQATRAASVRSIALRAFARCSSIAASSASLCLLTSSASILICSKRRRSSSRAAAFSARMRSLMRCSSCCFSFCRCLYSYSLAIRACLSRSNCSHTASETPGSRLTFSNASSGSSLASSGS